MITDWEKYQTSFGFSYLVKFRYPLLMFVRRLFVDLFSLIVVCPVNPGLYVFHIRGLKHLKRLWFGFGSVPCPCVGSRSRAAVAFRSRASVMSEVSIFGTQRKTSFATRSPDSMGLQSFLADHAKMVSAHLVNTKHGCIPNLE